MAVFQCAECLNCDKNCRQYNEFDKKQCWYWINRMLIPTDKQRFNFKGAE